MPFAAGLDVAVSPTREHVLAKVAQVAVEQKRRPILVLGMDGAGVATRPQSARGTRPGRKQSTRQTCALARPGVRKVFCSLPAFVSGRGFFCCWQHYRMFCAVTQPCVSQSPVHGKSEEERQRDPKHDPAT
jgi:hypothetical protein